MALYVIERNFADQLEATDDDVELIEEVNSGEGPPLALRCGPVVTKRHA